MNSGSHGLCLLPLFTKYLNIFRILSLNSAFDPRKCVVDSQMNYHQRWLLQSLKHPNNVPHAIINEDRPRYGIEGTSISSTQSFIMRLREICHNTTQICQLIGFYSFFVFIFMATHRRSVHRPIPSAEPLPFACHLFLIHSSPKRLSIKLFHVHSYYNSKRRHPDLLKYFPLFYFYIRIFRIVC